MSTEPKKAEQDARSNFAEQAEKETRGFLYEMGEFLLQNKKWWLTPIVLVLLLVGILVMLAGSVAAPFVYPLF